MSTGGQKSTNKIRTYLNRCKFLHISAHILCFRCSEDGEEIAAFHLDISVRLTQLNLSNVKFLFPFSSKGESEEVPSLLLHRRGQLHRSKEKPQVRSILGEIVIFLDQTFFFRLICLNHS